ncbi:GGDEF domain-containing protein [Mycobacterium kiyosense]|uniref:GGDEF domain-containing protein n=2 Tax=Mycobacteriaceae TaxID=1762 RepID=A0A9P3V000_9MYCO|nr:GGDEF domain-containing protein [Mycobacterium kiyosense]BDE16598.1 GGDEF domain-containing protein [Mycobacterium sp. 20KCMC460]GLB84732.1 GGDEF domain-containing protein [Mycobacterium kiyosense]GLB89869.1 GGDEF domain-containing protein [Mycobacterium kiyosense]GLB95839.1 GGDEF domain-containing protein [Mycobacterium kiyosense]
MESGALTESALTAQLAAEWPSEAADFTLSGTGPPVWQCVITPLDEPDGSATHMAIVRLPTDSQLRNDADFALVESLPDIVSRYDRNLRHLYVNPSLDKVTAPLTAQDHIGKDHYELNNAPEMAALFQSVYRTVFATGEVTQQDFEYPALDGPRHFVFRVVPEYGPDGEIRTVLNTARDITEIKALQRELEKLARSDPLTSLLNRRGFVDRAEAELQRVRRGDGRLSLLLLDIDDFKLVNDRSGHGAGDLVLIAIGDVLREELASGDFAGRVGGDEFCVAFVDSPAAEVRAQRIRHRISGLDERYGCTPGVGVSIGLTAAGADDSFADLIVRVDEAMYREKAANRARANHGSA